MAKTITAASHGCSGASPCGVSASLSVSAADITFSYNSVTNLMSFSTSSITRDETTVKVQAIITKPPGLLDPCRV